MNRPKKIVAHLPMVECLPILHYNLEARPVTKCDKSSLAFSVNRTIINLPMVRNVRSVLLSMFLELSVDELLVGH